MKVSYTKEQLDIISSSTNLVVDAIPGSGKTFTMVAKAVYESKLGNKVLVLTHTKKAAGIFHNRINKFNLKNIDVKTIHALSFNILSNNGYSFDDLNNYAEMLETSIYFESPKYDVIIIDEAQDINKSQYKVINSIKARKIFIGDRNQTIFGFTGASPSLFQYLISNGYRYKTLSYTFRTSGMIVDYINFFKKQAILKGPEIHPFNNFNTKVMLRTKDSFAPKGYINIVRYNNQKKSKNTINIHEAKGKEFNDVFIKIPNANYFKKDKDKNLLLYVALTRAKYNLIIAGYNYIDEIQNFTGGKSANKKRKI